MSQTYLPCENCGAVAATCVGRAGSEDKLHCTACNKTTYVERSDAETHVSTQDATIEQESAYRAPLDVLTHVEAHNNVPSTGNEPDWPAARRPMRLFNHTTDKD